MKNALGKISGFILGAAGFLLLFKLIVLDRTAPEDELGPGMVVIAAIITGVLFAGLGSRIQNYLMKKS